MKDSRSMVDTAFTEDVGTEDTAEKGRYYRRRQGPQVGSNPTFGNVGKDETASKTFVKTVQGTSIGSSPSYGNIGSNPKGKF